MRTRTWQSIWFPAVYLLASRISCFMLYCVCFCVVVRPIHFDAVTNSRCGCFVVASIFMFVVEMICDVCIFERKHVYSLRDMWRWCTTYHIPQKANIAVPIGWVRFVTLAIVHKRLQLRPITFAFQKIRHENLKQKRIWYILFLNDTTRVGG